MGKHDERSMFRKLAAFGGIGAGAAALASLRTTESQTAPTGPAPVVVTGPSGVGKGTLIGRLIKERPDKVGFSVSHTTRGPRPGEVDGTHYHFVTHEEIEKLIANGDFIEHARVHTNVYGTSKQAVKAVQAEGKTCLLDIDTQGAKSIKAIPGFAARFVFIAPPSLEALEARLRGRGTETEEKIQIRTANAKHEMETLKIPGFWDHVVYNDDLDTACAEFNGFILG